MAQKSQANAAWENKLQSFIAWKLVGTETFFKVVREIGVLAEPGICQCHTVLSTSWPGRIDKQRLWPQLCRVLSIKNQGSTRSEPTRQLSTSSDCRLLLLGDGQN